MRREDAVPVEADAPLPAQRVAPDDAGFLPRGTPDGRSTSDREGGSPKRERRRRTSLVDKLLIGTGLGLTLLVVIGAVGARVVTNQVLGDVQRIPDVFGSINPATRPAKPAGAEKTLNFLLMGIDTGIDAQTTGSGGTAASPSGRERSDVVMLVHVAADRRSASFVSIPRDTWCRCRARA